MISKSKHDKKLDEEIKSFKKDVEEMIIESKDDKEDLINSIAFYCFLLVHLNDGSIKC